MKMKPYKSPKIKVHGSLIDITKQGKQPGGSDAFQGSGIMPT
jgi:hypothetical protein